MQEQKKRSGQLGSSRDHQAAPVDVDNEPDSDKEIAPREPQGQENESDDDAIIPSLRSRAPQSAHATVVAGLLTKEDVTDADLLPPGCRLQLQGAHSWTLFYDAKTRGEGQKSRSRGWAPSSKTTKELSARLQFELTSPTKPASQWPITRTMVMSQRPLTCSTLQLSPNVESQSTTSSSLAAGTLSRRFSIKSVTNIRSASSIAYSTEQKKCATHKTTW